mgnify:CR=1 FL=1
MPTIYDVAKLAGVSPKTVSRVINADAPVGISTRERVESAIHDLGYRPSKAARMMRSNRSGLVGLITGAISQIPDTNEPRGLPDLFLIQGIQKVMAEHDLILTIADTGGDYDRVPRLIEAFLEHRVEGLIYVADHHQQVNLDVYKADVPVLLVNCYDDKQTPSILPDDIAGQRDLVERLIAHGHRRIAFLGLDQNTAAGALRLEGYRQAMQGAGLPIDTSWVQQGHSRQASDLNAYLDNALSQVLPSKPSVICCGNDEMALRVYGLLRTQGIRVPEEVSVAGYDNYKAIAETLYPTLTTVELPYVDMGRLAGQQLVDMIEGRTGPTDSPRLVAGPVVWRSSVTSLASSTIQ